MNGRSAAAAGRDGLDRGRMPAIFARSLGKAPRAAVARSDALGETEQQQKTTRRRRRRRPRRANRIVFTFNSSSPPRPFVITLLDATDRKPNVFVVNVVSASENTFQFRHYMPRNLLYRLRYFILSRYSVRENVHNNSKNVKSHVFLHF